MVDPKAIKAMEKAIKLIKKGWTQDAFARNILKTPINEKRSDAVEFCMVGAINRATFNGRKKNYDYDTRIEIFKAFEGCISVYPPGFPASRSDLIVFNDRAGRTKEEVLEAMNCALENLKKS